MESILGIDTASKPASFAEGACRLYGPSHTDEGDIDEGPASGDEEERERSDVAS